MEREPLVKPTWVIEFSKEENKGKRPAISMHIPSKEEKNLLADAKNVEKMNENFAEFVNAINKMCSLLQKNYQEQVKEIQDAKEEETKSVDLAATFGDFIRKFTEILKRLRNKEP